ncbi:MAG: transcription termination factor NusA [Oligoflexales bacterium]|nr:transcription termination factor NusA [Oligoflexales bacterium]
MGTSGETTKLSAIISAVSRDKSLDKSVIVDALEQALLHAARRDLGQDADLEAAYNEETDEVELFQFRTVIKNEDPIEAPEGRQIRLQEAKALDPEIEVGDSLGVKLDAVRFGRISAQSAKQIIVQKVRDAEKAQIYNEFKDRVGEILSGHVRRIERNDIIVDLGRTEAIISQKEQMSGEKFRVKDRVQGYVYEIKKAARGPQIMLSRAHPGFLIRLFEQHVTEIYDGIVSIESAARDPGLRSKIAVYSKDSSVDPVGACVGMKGARVQAVVQELNGEKIDIVPWDKDPAKLVCNALAPAVVSKVIVDEERKAMEVIVAEDQLSLAIGKRGQNVKLAAQLTGWRLDIKSEAKLEAQMAGVKSVLASIEGLGDMHAGILVHEGVKTPAELAELSPRVLSRLLNLEQEGAEKIIQRALEKARELDKGALVDTADYRAQDAAAEPSSLAPQLRDDNRKQRTEVFTNLKGVGEATAYALAEAGYATIGDIIADSADEVAQKAGLSLGVARTVQIAADRYLQEVATNQAKGT